MICIFEFPELLDTLVHARGLCSDVFHDVFSFIDAMSTETWIETFKKETVDIAKMDVNALTYVESASRMRQLLKTGRVVIVCEMPSFIVRNCFEFSV